MEGRPTKSRPRKVRVSLNQRSFDGSDIGFSFYQGVDFLPNVVSDDTGFDREMMLVHLDRYKIVDVTKRTHMHRRSAASTLPSLRGRLLIHPITTHFLRPLHSTDACA